jgi:ubiquinone/menaquinone biosynthesis C-methylase UbiE
VGLATSAIPYEEPLRVEKRNRILQLNSGERVRQGVAIVSASARLALSRRDRDAPATSGIEVVRFANEAHEKICGILNRSANARGGTAVLIPPAWGRTKETLLPLAMTIVATFDRAGESVSVLRFDGVRRRGESHNDLVCLPAGREYHHFTISQAVRDIRTAARFLKNEAGVERVALVTFSAAAIEGRRAVVEDGGANIGAWISVVGASDLQSGMRTVSGGVDYFGGANQGISFGFQEIMGVSTDIDRLANDALQGQLAFLEDSRRDMAQINVPVTWIHGSNDAWLDLGRVREIMACGDRSQRRLIEVPTGHQLKNSREALAVFGLVAAEVARLSLRRQVKPGLPDLVQLKRRGAYERRRLAPAAVRLRDFWRDYLLGRDGGLGIEMMNATRAYRDFMNLQVGGLALRDGQRVLDLGAGAGAFPVHITDSVSHPTKLVIDEVDYVAEALERSRQRMTARNCDDVGINYIVCDLDDRASVRRLIRSECYDATLASLLLSYVKRPQPLLREIHRSLRKTGRFVVSSLRRDADFSKLYLEGIEELRAGRAREVFGAEGERQFSASATQFLNDAARVLDFEEAGVFRFWDGDELATAVEEAGFAIVSVADAFGTPPQAVVVCAERR